MAQRVDGVVRIRVYTIVVHAVSQQLDRVRDILWTFIQSNTFSRQCYATYYFTKKGRPNLRDANTQLLLQPKQCLQSASFTTQVLATPSLLARLLRLSFTSWCLGWLGTLPCPRCSECERRTPRHPCLPGYFGYGPCQPESVAFLTSRAWLFVNGLESSFNCYWSLATRNWRQGRFSSLLYSHFRVVLSIHQFCFVNCFWEFKHIHCFCELIVLKYLHDWWCTYISIDTWCTRVCGLCECM